MTRIIGVFLLLIMAFPALAQTGDESAPLRKEVALMQGLDKVTAVISTFEAPVGQPTRFGSLEVMVKACFRTPPTEPPESTAFLEIDDIRPDGPRVRAFQGWMFASSPAVSALEHPVYDVWVKECVDPQAPKEAEPAEAAPEEAEPEETASDS